MKVTLELDASNRIVLSKELRRAAGIPRRQKLMVSATPGRIVLEMEPNTSGRIVKRGKLKIWTGAVPALPIEQAVEQARHYSR
jgi:bifunctional DNA-binding transcriptional regulator/antitoxin component of YhaV-PrlF toxin-antitoxin module